jgi:hypothetical protein
VAGGECVADEDGIDGRDVDRDAAGRVTGQPDDAGRARQVEHVAVVHRDDLGDGRGAQPVLAHGVPEEARRRTDADVAPRGLRRHLAAGARGIGLVHVDGHAPFAAEPFGEPDVVAVAVGQHDAAHVVERSTHAGELGDELVPVPGEARVDDGDALGGVDQVHGDDVVADAVQGGAEFHRVSSVCGGSINDGYAT